LIMPDLELLKDVQRENYFQVSNGTIIRSMLELDEALENMSNETFQYHVNNYKNDLANWIKDTIKDDVLANKLNGIIDKTKTELIVLRRIIEILKSNCVA